MRDNQKTFRERQQEKKAGRIFNALAILLIAGLWVYILNGIAEALAK